MQEKRLITRLLDKSEAPMVVLDRTKVTDGQTASLTVTLRKRDARRLCGRDRLDARRLHEHVAAGRGHTLRVRIEKRG